jgi:hypothetical protein
VSISCALMICILMICDERREIRFLLWYFKLWFLITLIFYMPVFSHVKFYFAVVWVLVCFILPTVCSQWPHPYFQYCLCADRLIRPVQTSTKILHYILFYMHTQFIYKLHNKYKKKDWELKKNYLYISNCK